MKKTILCSLLAFLVSGCGTNVTKVKESPYSGHPILGTWTYNKSGCDEIYSFETGGIRRVKSNEELVISKYEITTVNEEKNVFLLRHEVISDNGKTDCSGSSEVMTGDVVEVLVFIESNPKRFSFCFHSSLTNCVGPFVKNE